MISGIIKRYELAEIALACRVSVAYTRIGKIRQIGDPEKFQNAAFRAASHELRAASFWHSLQSGSKESQ
jgi:hypothetical protein